KEIFEAIAGTDKVITFKQEDGTSWTFNGKDIDKNNLKDIKLSLSNKPSEEAKVAINEVDKNPIFIKFDYHGILPGKALVKIKLENYEDLKDKNLTLYYYNEETKSIEKINDNIKVDNNGFVTIEISHCSDYFLSQNPSITTDKDEQDNTTDNNNENKNEDASNSNGEGSTGNSNNGSNNGNPNNGSNSGGVLDSSLSNATSENTNNKNEDELKDLPKTGAVVSSLSYVLIGAFIIVIGLGLTKKRKTLENK
ncbi:MAG: LPXTG cell wall anchor domain-containing protein, partial [Clostridium sartagoforme]|nr:LPXTG cell wall anchor domain-containing protein [Clostridium sartagoforme]